MPEHLENVESKARDLGRVIRAVLDQQFGATHVGFALLLFDFGGAGYLTYVSNTEREDMIRGLAECQQMLKSDGDKHHLAPRKRTRHKENAT
jgi:hypothetical protein